MFIIRRIHDTDLPANQAAIASVQRLLRERFSALRDEEIDGLPEKLRNPFLQRFAAVLYVAERPRLHEVQGFALVLREPVLGFCYLDFLAAAPESHGGVGAGLYERVREDARAYGAKGLFFECLPDAPNPALPAEELSANRARLRFYERWDARPIVGTAYEKPVSPTDLSPPHLVCDTLGSPEALRRTHVRKVVRAVLERKYAYLCPPNYVEEVVHSIQDDPVRLRPPKFKTRQPARPPKALRSSLGYPIVVNQKHSIHHVRERGYVEAPIRVRSILDVLEPAGMFRAINAKHCRLESLCAVHDKDFLEYLQRACASVPEGKSVYPYVFPIRNAARQPKELAMRAGYYCIDTFTPLNRNAFLAARGAVDCALTAADCILDGERLAYALVRPPGHHAERRSYGGFCYFNNTAIAAHRLSQQGKVAILDIDYHHGNGQQDIFYARNDVLTVSIHGHPDFAYPYFTGFTEERGDGDGVGYNLNLPLKERIDGKTYRKVLQGALDEIAAFQPSFLVVALGLDTAQGDPTGTWSLRAADFENNGAAIGKLNLPTLVVQEGGYRTRALGANATSFFRGLTHAIQVS